MALTAAQIVTFKAAILAETDPAIVAARTPATRHDAAIEAFYNAEAPGPVKVWRNDIASVELVEATIDNIAEFDNLTAGKRDAWNVMFQLPTFDFRRNKLRKAAGRVWALAQATAILNAVGTRNALRCELLFGAVDVTDDGVTAKKCDFLGTLSRNDVSDALNLA